MRAQTDVFAFHVSAETGFPMLLHMWSEEKGETVFDLVELEVDVELDDALFDEATDDEREDHSDQLAFQLAVNTLNQSRARIYTVHSEGADGAEIDPDELAAALRVLHLIRFEGILDAMRAELGVQIDAFGQWIDDNEGEAGSEAIEQAIDARRNGLHETLSAAVESFLERLSAPRGLDLAASDVDAALELESSTLQEMLTDELATPLLERFDEVVETNRSG